LLWPSAADVRVQQFRGGSAVCSAATVIIRAHRATCLQQVRKTMPQDKSCPHLISSLESPSDLVVGVQCSVSRSFPDRTYLSSSISSKTLRDRRFIRGALMTYFYSLPFIYVSFYVTANSLCAVNTEKSYLTLFGTSIDPGWTLVAFLGRPPRVGDRF
jgi:hypothetical protein